MTEGHKDGLLWLQYAPMRYARASLRFPPPHLISGDGNLDSLRQSWIQGDKWWLLMLYGHAGIAYVNAVAHRFRPGTLLLFPPGSRGGHPIVGPGTPHGFFQFSLLDDDRDLVALPVRTDHDVPFAEEFASRVALINVSFAPVQAYLWKLLWDLSEHPRLVGSDDKLLDAEEFVAQHLSLIHI